MSHQFTVDGQLNVDTVQRHLIAGINAISNAGEHLEIDLSGSEFSGSAGIALLIAWLRHAEKSGTTVKFAGIPDNLPAIARACGVENILGIQKSG